MITKPRKPARVREIEGKRGHRPIPNEPAGKGLPAMPEVGKIEVKRLFTLIATSMPDGVYSQADSPMLERMAINWARWRACQRQIDKDGILVRKAPKSTVMVRHPYLNIQKEAADEMHRCSAELGLSPVARTRITAPKSADVDPLELLLDGRADGAYYQPAPKRRMKVVEGSDE